MADDRSRSRHLWRRWESYHGMIYFAPEAHEAYSSLGAIQPMMGYFASRAAPMGAVDGGVVTATFYNFEPSRITALVPAAWSVAPPEQWHQARMSAVDAALRRLLPGVESRDDVARAAAVLSACCQSLRPDGRPLYAGHASLPWPDAPHLQLWHALTLLREHRGDGHVAALVADDVSGIQALVMHAASGAVPSAVLQQSRGWGDAAWGSAVAELQAGGVLDASGAFTADGARRRQWVEDRTDALAEPACATLSTGEVDWLAALGKELSTAIAQSGVFARMPG
jgi:hypothetical protein